MHADGDSSNFLSACFYVIQKYAKSKRLHLKSAAFGQLPAKIPLLASHRAYEGNKDRRQTSRRTKPL